jgi:hypothetical protein
MYIGIYGHVGGNYKLLAKESPPKAVLLLHGLNSDASTWNVDGGNGVIYLLAKLREA